VSQPAVTEGQVVEGVDRRQAGVVLLQLLDGVGATDQRAAERDGLRGPGAPRNLSGRQVHRHRQR